jgi:hypothetical protein
MKNTLSTGTSHTRGARAEEDRAEPQRGPDLPHRRAKLLEFLAWRSFGVRFTLSRAKRRARGRGTGPIKCMVGF